MIRQIALVGLAIAAHASAQTSVRNGVFTAGQLQRGQTAYGEECARCHGQTLSGGEGSPELAGDTFVTRWKGHSVGDLLERTRKTMPVDNPGGLNAQKYADIVSYVLSVNGFPAGSRQLPLDSPTLAAIRIESPLPGATRPTVPATSIPRPTTKPGEWRYYGGDAASTKYSPLDQIDRTNVKKLHIAWTWKSQNFGRRAEFNWEVTPLMIGNTLYFTAGTRRDAVAVDAETGETLWMYRLEEGSRGVSAARQNNRGLAYWTDGHGVERILMISPGYQLIALDAATGRPAPGFGKDGVTDLWLGLDRPVVKPGQIGASSPPLVVGDVVVVGAALQSGISPPSKNNVPGYIRGYDVRTGKLLWTFHTIPQPGEFGHQTWEGNSWNYTGNTGAWAPLSADLELGYVYIPVETPTADFYGGHRLGDNLFAESLVCLDARTGKHVWHFQFVHHGIWDWDLPTAPTLLDINVEGKKIKAVAQITKQAWVYVFDRVTGKPVWPIEERPVPQSTVQGERTSATQPFPTKPAPFDRQGFSLDDVIDLTPQLKEEALRIVEQYRIGPMFMPPSVADAGGKRATITLPSPTGGANWQGGAADPEAGVLYVSSITYAAPVWLSRNSPKAEIDYGGHYGLSNMGPQGLPLVKPPWGRITAIDLNTGEHLWMVPNGSAPEAVRNHPALKGVDLSKAGNPEHAPILATKTLLFTGDGAGLYAVPPGAGGPMFRALDKKTGAILHEMKLPANITGIPMSYMSDGKQYIVMAIGASGVPAELIALTVE